MTEKLQGYIYEKLVQEMLDIDMAISENIDQPRESQRKEIQKFFIQHCIEQSSKSKVIF